VTKARYAVVGDPIAQSKSPQIHQMFARQTGEQIFYEAIKVESAEFEDFVTSFFAAGGSGLNVTLPHKQAAFDLAERSADRARLAGAANTLFLQDDQLMADNTDGAGLLRDIESNLGLSVQDKSILLLGAGGASRGVLPVLLGAAPESVTLLNRTVAKAQAIAAELDAGSLLKVADYETFSATAFDFIINATSMSLHGQVPPLPLAVIGEQCCCYDMMYGDSETAFLRWARTLGASQLADGLGMLIEQAAESFFLWRRIRPDTQPVLEALREPKQRP